MFGRLSRLVCVGVLLGVGAAGCGQVRETLPPRSALEQLLISTAADRAIARMPRGRFADTKVFLDGTNLEGYDKSYVVLALRKALLDAGAVLAPNAQDADVILEVASGGLSINSRHHLLGIPELPLPIPFAGESLKTPEIPIFKALFYRGRAKLLFAARDARTQRSAFPLPVCYGKSLASYWWILLTGPHEWTDLPETPRALEEAKQLIRRGGKAPG